MSPAQPIQSPPIFARMGFIALANPPELLTVSQPPSVFFKVRGSRFETTTSRDPWLGFIALKPGIGCKLILRSPSAFASTSYTRPYEASAPGASQAFDA